MRGFAYYAIGDKYRLQFKKSVTLLREHHPDDKIWLFTDEKTKDTKLANKVIRTRPAKFFGDGNWKSKKRDFYRDNLQCLKKAFDKTIFLDTDIAVCDSLDELFQLLERFDVANPTAPYRLWNCDFDCVPKCFCQLNTGIYVYNNNGTFHRVLDQTLHYIDMLKVQDKEMGVQPAYRRALYESDLDFCMLPSEYNFRTKYLAYAQQPIKILHDSELMNKSLGEIRKRIKLVNQKKYTPRAWMPGKGMMYDKTRREYD